MHFRDIGQDPDVHDVTYENGQARERTQILMDIANKTRRHGHRQPAICRSWHSAGRPITATICPCMAVNASVPKTLVRHLVRYYADTCGDEELRDSACWMFWIRR